MPRISTYAVDTVDKSDKLIGTSSSGGTKNFEIQDISKFFKETNAAGIAAQFVFQYKSDGTRQNGGITATFSSGSTFANLTAVEVNNKSFGETDPMTNLLAMFASKDILIVDIENQNNFGIYAAGTPTQDSGTDYYDISLGSPQSSNGSLVNNKFYAVVIFSGGADKSRSLTFSPTNFAGHPSLSTETVNGSTMNYIDWEHGLNKFPSITVTEAFSTTGVGFVPYKYIDANNVRVYFHGGTNGKIYAN